MKGYKGFEQGMICRGKQYEEDTVFREARANPCKSGMHFCENPFDVLSYYPIVNNNGDFNEFAEVEALDEPVTDDGRKFASTELKIGAKLSFRGFIDACIEFVMKKTKSDFGSDLDACIGSSGDYAQIGSSRDYAKIGSSGKNSVIMCAGNGSKAKAKKGSWITLAEWQTVGDEWKPVCVKTEQVDGERIKEDTFYILKGGEFVECE